MHSEMLELVVNQSDAYPQWLAAQQTRPSYVKSTSPWPPKWTKNANKVTAEFIKNLSGDSKADANLIGQFGVGFYSAFIVAEQVTVRTRRAGNDASEAVEWSSDGDGQYTIKGIEKSDRGTEIRLILKEDASEFGETYRIRHLVTKYSQGFVLERSLLHSPPWQIEPDSKPLQIRPMHSSSHQKWEPLDWGKPKQFQQKEDAQGHQGHKHSPSWPQNSLSQTMSRPLFFDQCDMH